MLRAESFAEDEDLPGARPTPPKVVPKPVNLLVDDPLPSGRKATVRGFLSAHQSELFKALTSGQPQRVARATDELMLYALRSLDERDHADLKLADVRGLHSADRREVLLRSRRRTYRDPVVVFTWECLPPAIRSGGCGATTKARVHLDKLMWVPASTAKTVKLGDARVIQFDVPTGHTEAEYAALNKDPNAIDMIDLALARRARVGTEPLSKEELQQFEGDDYIRVLEALLDQGGTDSRVESRCFVCKASLKTRVEALPGFFYPVDALS